MPDPTGATRLPTVTWGKRWAAGVMLLVLALASCSSDSEEDDTATEGAGTTSSTAAARASDLVSEELAGFESRSVTFANVEFTVTGVTVSNQTLRSYAEGGEPDIDTERAHAFLDITAVNRMTATQTQGLGVEAFRLRLDGDEVPAADELAFLSDLTSIIRPAASVDSFLAFPVPSGTDLSDAILLIGVAPDRTASLPLTGEVPPGPFPIEVDVSGSAEGVGPTNGGTIEFTVLGATLSEDRPHEHSTSPTGDRANEDELFLVVEVRAEKTSGRGSDLLGADAFRLLVDGVPRSPWDVATEPTGSTETPSVDPGAAVDAWVAFMVPIDAVEFELQVGDLEEPGVIPLPLPDMTEE